MAHKVMVGGTVREVSGGKVMVGGTVREISGGKTMVGGTVREIAFGSDPIVTITGTGGSRVYLKIGGTTYTAATTLEVPAGTVIYCYATNSMSQFSNSITLNGSTVATAAGKTAATYNYTVKGNVTINMNQGAAGKITITEG